MKDSLQWLSRSALLVGEAGIERLQKTHVLVVGLGGVGSFAAEFIARAGVGEMSIVDGDVVDPSNRNRQLVALSSNHGVSKAQIMAQRLLDINPELRLHVHERFLSPEAAAEILERHPYDYVLDCIDSVSPKLNLLKTAYDLNLRIVSSMGAGGKMDPTQIRVSELLDTHECYLAALVRKRIRKMGVDRGIKAVFSLEKVKDESLILTDGSNYKRSAYGTISYLPAAFGGACASVAIRDLLEEPFPLERRPKGLLKPKKKKTND